MIKPLLLYLFLFAATVPAQVCFTPEIITECQDLGEDLVAGDFDNDGMPDLAVTLSYLKKVQLLKGLGTGSFVSLGLLTASNTPARITGGDFNNDGNMDFAVNNQFYNATIFHGNGSFGFSSSSPAAFTTGWSRLGITNGDFNNDGTKDLVVCYDGSNNIGLLIANGNNYNPPGALLSVGNRPADLVAADFNGDGNQDIVTANATDNTVSLRFGNGAGSFSAVNTFSTDLDPGSVISDDFNGDGGPDLVTANCGPANTGTNTISVLLNNGQGGFMAAQNIFVGTCTSDVATGDFNGDGNRDLVVSVTMGQQVAILLGNGLGGFSAPVYIPSLIYPLFVVTADFNADGKDDFAVTHPGRVGVFLNTGTFMNVSSSSTVICAGESVTLQVSGGGGKSYGWSTGSTDTSITVAPLINTAYTVLTTDSSGCANSAVYGIHVDACAGLKQFKNPETELFTSYPNPATGSQFTVRSGADLEVSVINLTGQLVKTVALSAANQHSITISNLPPGSYLLSAQSGGFKTVRRIVLCR